MGKYPQIIKQDEVGQQQGQQIMGKDPKTAPNIGEHLINYLPLPILGMPDDLPMSDLGFLDELDFCKCSTF